MLQITLNLPKRYRLGLNLSKRRGPSVQNGFITNLTKYLKKRGGTKLSRFFRFVFEKYSIKNIIGANLVVLSIATSMFEFPKSVNFDNDNVEIKSPVVLTTKKGVRVPLEAKNITQGYWALHHGVDLNGETGDYVYPMSGGMVEEAGTSNTGYGKMVLINHKNGYKTLYAHLSVINVEVGQEVTNETKIGEVGATGRAFGDHLHMEVFENGSTINPLSILPN